MKAMALPYRSSIMSLFSLIAELAKNDIVVTMLGSDDAVKEVFDQYLAGKPKSGSIFVECSTVYPDIATELGKKAKDAGVTYVTAPVIGRPNAAMEGSLLCILAGDPSAKAKVTHAQSTTISLITLFNLLLRCEVSLKECSSRFGTTEEGTSVTLFYSFSVWPCLQKMQLRCHSLQHCKVNQDMFVPVF